ncbi:MAG: hypothetical protein EA376_00085 [Phycisphaeraceae bacterium]|nr:MAG: hypothetical protein EA376_00085 [Phycisphaeraceae bacterium]
MPQNDNDTPQAGPEQIELLASLIDQARAKGVRTGVRNDELEDLDEAQASELIEQLQIRLGQASG